jgi:hypothetical protein
VYLLHPTFYVLRPTSHQAPLLEQCDVISLHVPMMPATKHMLNEETLGGSTDPAYLQSILYLHNSVINTSVGSLLLNISVGSLLPGLMKPNAHILNFSRGGLVDNEALLKRWKGEGVYNDNDGRMWI